MTDPNDELNTELNDDMAELSEIVADNIDDMMENNMNNADNLEGMGDGEEGEGGEDGEGGEGGGDAEEDLPKSRFDDLVDKGTEVTFDIEKVDGQNVVNKLCLIVNYFNDKRVDRQKEYNYCLMRNLNNPIFERVYVFIRSDEDIVWPEEISDVGHEKMEIVTMRDGMRWLTYDEAFNFANDRLVGKTVVLANLDIYLRDEVGPENEYWECVDSVFDENPKRFMCLSRIDIDMAGNMSRDAKFGHLLHSYTQDCWVFKSPCHVDGAKFPLGVLGCDNTLAWCVNNSDYEVVNDPLTYHVYHVDNLRKPNGDTYVKLYKDEVQKGLREDLMEREKILEKQYFVPDYKGIQNVSIEVLFAKLQVSDMEIYRIKSDLLSKHLSVKI